MSKATPTTKAAAAPDWERIELDYRAGIKTLRQIAAKQGISEGAIRKRAKREDWTRDLSGRIQDKAEQLVRKQAVRKEVRKQSAVSERVLVEANAQAVADVRLAHRHDIHRARRLTNALLDELEHQTDPATLALLSDLGELLIEPDERGVDKLNDLYRAIISLPERSKTLKVLAESLQKLVDMERKAFGMDTEVQQQADPLATLLHTIATGNSSGFLPQADDPEKPQPEAKPSTIGPQAADPERGR